MSSEKPTANPARDLILGDDLAAPANRESSAGRVFSALRDMSPTERRYQARRALVILSGLVALSLPFFAVWWVKAIISDSGQSAAREINGPFAIRLEVTTGENPLPGARPRLIARALPKLNEESGEWVEIFRIAVDDIAALDVTYAEFVSNQVGFVFFDSLYAVTTNGGHTWTTLSVFESDPPAKALHIDGVILDEYGEGLLFPVGVKSYDSAWVTDNYGLVWSAP